MLARLRPFVIGFGIVFVIALLRKDSAFPESDYDRLLVSRKLLERGNNVVLMKTSGPAYYAVRNLENALDLFHVVYEAENLMHDSKNRVEDAGNRVTVCGRSGKTKKGFLLWGPYGRFPAGRYELMVTMKAENIVDASRPVASFHAASSRGRVVHKEKEISGTDLPAPGEYAGIAVPLEMKREVSDIEFRIYYPGNADICVDKIDIIVLG